MYSGYSRATFSFFIQIFYNIITTSNAVKFAKFYKLPIRSINCWSINHFNSKRHLSLQKLTQIHKILFSRRKNNSSSLWYPNPLLSENKLLKSFATIRVKTWPFGQVNFHPWLFVTEPLKVFCTIGENRKFAD